ncbi:MAG: UDP-3-O-(3-hydroxymyristoyl)glucosamine N-acyltransferase [Bacteroidales bacterium]|nr:UDP-3-O-(3-hydroxymyristoyl)glucosamine N-acyltransferase [Bacteroidales bacterium]
MAPTATLGHNLYLGVLVWVGAGGLIGDGASLYPHTVVGDRVTIGARTTLYAGVKVYEDCSIGTDCILHAGAVIGADGFGFAQQDGEYLKIPQIGNVEIGNYVEIGANTCIDRATMGSTRIHDHVKIDNLVQIAHNVTVGEGTAFAAQAGVAGSAKIGAKCIVAGQAGISGHLSIDDGSVIGAQSGVTHSLKKGVYLGSPAIPASEERKLIVLRRKLPELYQQFIRKKNQ